MSIINHGTWVRYIPDPDDIPEHAPTNALYVRRESDLVDWYQATQLAVVTPMFGVGNVIAAGAPVGDGTYKIGPATRQFTEIFPINSVVIEITDYLGVDPFAAFNGKIYDPVAGAILEAPAVEYNVPRSVIVERINAAGKMNQLKAFFNSHEFEKEMWYANQVFKPSSAVALAIVAGIGADPAVILAEAP